ncbi:Clavaminate synthase-like protein [Atractiella rhizophila]|nr:Clavaminate synthase-like protein [Atractiella rhizophila]
MSYKVVQTGTGQRVVPTGVDSVPVVEDFIPVIDLDAPRDVVVASLREACKNVGFFYIKNHGVSEELIQRTFDESKRFMDLPIDVKARVRHTGKKKGYVPLLGEQVDPDSKGDLHENFDFGTQGHGSFEEEDENLNQWLDEDTLPGFKSNVVDYWRELGDLAKRITPFLALALDLEPEYFQTRLKHPNAVLRLIHYPPQENRIDESCIGIGAHHDYEIITILHQGDIPALQILDADNRWIGAPIIPGTFICNLGDQLARWTNETFKSTLHRVINRSGKERYSLPFFYAADYDVPLDVIPSCVSDANPQKYPTILAGEYMRMRIEETFHSEVKAA